jgi:hypothetical protein
VSVRNVSCDALFMLYCNLCVVPVFCCVTCYLCCIVQLLAVMCV